MGKRLFILVTLLLVACNGVDDVTESLSPGSESNSQESALESVECWFDSPRRLTETDCFYN